MKKLTLIIAIFFSGMLVQSQAFPDDKANNSNLLKEYTRSFLVQRVIDGDTFVLETGEKVRLIGIDTPETVHPRKPIEQFGPGSISVYKKNVRRQIR